MKNLDDVCKEKLKSVYSILEDLKKEIWEEGFIQDDTIFTYKVDMFGVEACIKFGKEIKCSLFYKDIDINNYPNPSLSLFTEKESVSIIYLWDNPLDQLSNFFTLLKEKIEYSNYLDLDYLP